MDLRRLAPVVASVSVVALAIACADDGPAAVGRADDGRPEATHAADPATGRQVLKVRGCAACHGSDWSGGVGPSLVGLYGSERPLDDGTSVIADVDYLVRAVRDPQAEIVEGYFVPMPTIDLDDDELAAVVAFIRELGDES